MEYLESTKQTQAESHLLPYQRSAIDGRGELERDEEMQSQADRITSTPHTKWTAPTPNTYKINYDGALSNADNKSGIGVVVWDCRGRLLCHLCSS